MASYRGMEAVARKGEKKRAVMAKKGAMKGDAPPGMAVMIAFGGPKKGPKGPMRGPASQFMDDDEDVDEGMGDDMRGDMRGGMSPASEIARLKAENADLRARLAEYEGEQVTRNEGEDEDEEYEEEED